MKWIYFLLLLTLVACNSSTETNEATIDTLVMNDTTTMDTSAPAKPIEVEEEPMDSVKEYNNTRFKNVTVEKTGADTYLIKGRAQVFEAVFGWVIEDGHNELKQGHEMSDAGAPAWGKFSFTVTAKRQRENSTLHLILFEASANDGSRQHQLPIPLN